MLSFFACLMALSLASVVWHVGLCLEVFSLKFSLNAALVGAFIWLLSWADQWIEVKSSGMMSVKGFAWFGTLGRLNIPRTVVPISGQISLCELEERCRISGIASLLRDHCGA